MLEGTDTAERRTCPLNSNRSVRGNRFASPYDTSAKSIAVCQAWSSLKLLMISSAMSVRPFSNAL